VRVYSTSDRDLVELPPPPARIGIYTCGPTVYQRIHVGNARPFVLSLWLKRWLERRGHDVRLVENITDVNDRIYEAAPGRSAELAAQASAWYREDTDLLGLGRPDVEPKATETIDEILALIEELVRSGHAYEVQGDVYFRVSSYPDYGSLSRQRPDQVEEQEPNALKEDPRDFALWKANKPGEDTWWESPWGRGRPGWHIECSAMAEKFLGPTFDIHMGGLDLVFPHHENEIAQSRAAGREFARIWMHNGLLELVGEKMSKSVGNIAPLRDVVERWGRETLLVFFLSGKWSQPIDFSEETMEQARARWRSIAQRIYEAPPARPARPWEDFAGALEDDFNTPEALAVLHDWADAGQLDLLHEGLAVFGLDFVPERPPEEVQELAQKRQRAREEKDFAASDALRERIGDLGWAVQDTADGPVLVPK
jgi:cysteinyl-tRNA synthetase